MNITSKFGFMLSNKADNIEQTSVIARQIEALRTVVQRAKMGETAVYAPTITVKLNQLYKQ